MVDASDSSRDTNKLISLLQAAIKRDIDLKEIFVCVPASLDITITEDSYDIKLVSPLGNPVVQERRYSDDTGRCTFCHHGLIFHGPQGCTSGDCGCSGGLNVKE